MKKGIEKINKTTFYKTNPSGISLIVLVITIIVIIILATAIIVSIVNNNPISEANKARYESDRDNMQSIFTNTIGKIMAEKQGAIEVEAGRLNEPVSKKKSIVGEAVYKVNGNEGGKIIFDNKENTETDYYTGRQLPVYSKETIWHVDSEGILKLQVGYEIYGEGNVEDLNENIKISARVSVNENFTKATLGIIIEYEGEIESVTINGESVEVVKNEEGKYELNKEVVKNGNYTITVNAKDGSKNKEVVKVNDIVGDMNIYNREDMEKFRNIANAGATFEGNQIRVKENIDLGGSSNNWDPIKNFKGEFDGENHTIDNLYINREEGEQALFRQNEGTIKNIIVKGEVTGNGRMIAGICSINFGKIENVTNYANIYNRLESGEITGGIVGIQRGKTLIKCTNYGEIIANNQHAGGILGHLNSEDFIIDSCNNYGKVKSTNISGGIVGSATVNGVIQNCTNEAEIDTKASASGGILGYYYVSSKPVTIQKCINKGKINTDIWGSGGILGGIDTTANIFECRNIGEVLAETGNAGGIVGYACNNDTEIYTSKIERCINNGYVHANGNAGSPTCGGILGIISYGDNCVINDCYNTGKIDCKFYNSLHGVGGILGGTYDNATLVSQRSKATITNCYNIGNIVNSYSEANAGQILGRDNCNNRSISNCYYLNTSTGSNIYGGVALSLETLKDYASQLGEQNWKKDENNTNLGYPILKWE